MELIAQGDAHRIEVAEERVAPCMLRLRKAALALNGVLADSSNEDDRRRLVAGTLRLTDNV